VDSFKGLHIAVAGTVVAVAIADTAARRTRKVAQKSLVDFKVSSYNYSDSAEHITTKPTCCFGVVVDIKELLQD